MKKLVWFVILIGLFSGRAFSQDVNKTEAVAVDPIGFYNLGNACARRGENEAAIAAYRKAIEQRNGHYSRALNNLGVVLLRVGRWDEAQEALQSALQLELSYALLRLNRHDEALANLLEVSKRDGARFPISYFHLARLYERNGDLKLAEAAFSQVAPTNAQFLLDLSRVREKLGDYKGSLEAMERYLKLMQDQGRKPVWSDQRLAELRTKAAKQ